jgi:hypothetical protein
MHLSLPAFQQIWRDKDGSAAADLDGIPRPSITI